MRRANFCHRKQTRRRRVAQVPKLSQDGLKAEGDVTGDVLQEDPLGAAFANDAGDIGPEVAGVIGPFALSSGAERLAGISGEDDVEGTSEGPSIEAAQIVPDRGRGEVSAALGRDEDGSRPVLPFDEASGDRP